MDGRVFDKSGGRREMGGCDSSKIGVDGEPYLLSSCTTADARD